MIQLHFSDNTREKIELLVKIAKSLDFQHIKTEYIAEEEIHQQRIMILTFLDVCDFIEKYIKRKTIKNL